MNLIKIVPKFFSKTEAHKHSAFLLKKSGASPKKVLKAEMVNAYELYKTNKWFKNGPFKRLGMPTMSCYMVIVHYCEPVVEVPAPAIRKPTVFKPCMPMSMPLIRPRAVNLDMQSPISLNLSSFGTRWGNDLSSDRHYYYRIAA